MPASTRWSGSQRRIGLTGGIASGKSTVARWLEQQGLPVLDADVYAREALAPGTPGAAAVLERYGAVVRAQCSSTNSGVIDRGALGQIVFNAPQEREWLEQLVHPLVRERFDAELAALAAQPAVVLVIPLLFEAGLESLCSEIWLVDCEPEQQLERLMQRDGLNQAAAQARIHAQWPLERKRELADRVIDNRQGVVDLQATLSL
ncbi:MAG: dephospho-CoA kinase [Vulcanococcus sp.]|jgi:dephospho-CoA kinase|uniref:dephospho-CoA kinase n=1 Tax=Vulcanococcus sp. TaxID=2856995 RepID=UPI0025DD9F12|nr:dephospho-CoA kinase [Vulcanococcus sp.]MBW0181809.1 dephospho-CoA kinase [Vulcanococcus sp.]